MVPLINDARADAQTTLREMMQNFKKKRANRELEYDDEIDGEELEQGELPNEEPKEANAKPKAKGKAKAKPKPEKPAKGEGDTLDPKKVALETPRQP